MGRGDIDLTDAFSEGALLFPCAIGTRCDGF